MPEKYWPLGSGRVVTSPFGPRSGGFHYGVDFGRSGGSANMPVYAVDTGTVLYAGAASGYGGPDPAGWLVIDSNEGGVWEYGHIVRLPHIRVGSRVTAGEQIAVINPDSRTNGGTSPHLHVSFMPRGYNPAAKKDVLPELRGAKEPGGKGLRPDFNEFPLWSPNVSSRNGKKPIMFLLHTQEGNGNALSLAQWLAKPSSQVSYHYTVSQDPNDNGVTVVDTADTDVASWSVLDFNNISINLCFAGSSVNWPREQWLRNSKALEAAAYLACQDARKYGFKPIVIPPPYTSGTPGISDHAYVTSRGIGSHSDVGRHFPWKEFSEFVAKYSGQQETKPPTLPPVETASPSDQEVIRLVWDQLVGPGGRGWPQLGGKTLVDAVAEIRAKLGIV